jgi:hypothetical protein
VVKKLEKGSTVMRSTPQQQIKINIRKIQEKKKGHVASHCPTKLKAQETTSKKKRSSIKRRLCYQCKEKGHWATDYPQASSAD